MRRRLGVRLVKGMILISSAVTLLLTLVQVYRLYSVDVALLQRNIEQIRISQLDTIAGSLWALDQEQVQLAMEGLLRIPDVEYLRLVQTGKVALEYGALPAANATVRQVFELSYTQRGRTEALGQLEVFGSLSGARRRVLEQMGVILVSNGIKTFIVGAFMLLMVQWVVTRHLATIGAFARGVAQGRLDTELVLSGRNPETEGADELDLLAQHLNAMQSGIKAYISALGAEERRYRRLVETMTDGLGVVDTHGVLSYANKSLGVMLGYTTEELVGSLVTDYLLAPGQEVHFQEQFATRHAPRGDAPYELEFTRRDGTTVHTLISPRALTGESGEALGSFAIITDITERRQAELRVRQMNAELEQRVEERTAELRQAQESIVKQQKLATVGQLTATVSHELRNPLGSIRLSVSNLRLHLNDADTLTTRSLDRIERSMLRCDNIISDLLDFSRTRQPMLEPTLLDPWLLELLGEQEIPPEIEVQLDLGAEGLVMNLDRDHLRRAVINLVDNAVQAMAGATQEPDAQKTGASHAESLRVSSRIRDGRLTIQISDSGPGIPADTLERIFEPLFSTKVYGVGLGLPTVRQIMRQQGGDIEIASVPGEGSTATLWLPHPDPETERKA